MPVNFGSLSVANAFVGDKAVSAMYLGGTQVYPNEEEGTGDTTMGDIRLRIQTPDDATDLTFAFFNSVSRESGGYVAVDWGDGSSDKYSGSTSVSPTHTYAEAGEYVVKMTGSKFTEIYGSSSRYQYVNWVREILSLKMPTDSSGVSLYETFRGCNGLTGTIPEWDEKITSAYATYGYCNGLTGTIPEWGENIVLADATYCGCTGLTGEIPEWGEKITSAYATYDTCTGLTGEIPEWGENIVYAECTYFGCSGLESCSAELLENPMPSTITSYVDCVTGCVDAIRQHFTEAWGGTKTA